MATGMWTAASGAAAQAQSIDTIANNLANADTTAFKKDAVTFKEYLATLEREHPTQDIPRGPIQTRELYPLDGKDQSFVVMDGTHTLHEQGHLRVTQQPLDLALDGPGFLEVSTPMGIRYTRQGNLKLSSDGRLVTAEGFSVLASPNETPEAALNPSLSLPARYINLADHSRALTITEQGEIYDRNDLVAKIHLVEFKNLGKLRKTGGSLFESLDAKNSFAATRTAIRQGVLETSNVNPVEEMTKLITANRLFEQDLKALKTYGELLGKEANEVGKL
ncbi:MAG: flagellar hook-basal body protein [Bdellovibrionia bacterium]